MPKPKNKDIEIIPQAPTNVTPKAEPETPVASTPEAPELVQVFIPLHGKYEINESVIGGVSTKHATVTINGEATKIEANKPVLVHPDIAAILGQR